MSPLAFAHRFNSRAPFAGSNLPVHEPFYRAGDRGDIAIAGFTGSIACLAHEPGGDAPRKRIAADRHNSHVAAWAKGPDLIGVRPMPYDQRHDTPTKRSWLYSLTLGPFLRLAKEVRRISEGRHPAARSSSTQRGIPVMPPSQAKAFVARTAAASPICQICGANFTTNANAPSTAATRTPAMTWEATDESLSAMESKDTGGAP